MRHNHANKNYRHIITSRRWIKLRARKMLQNGIDNGGFCEACVRRYKERGGEKPRKAVEVHHVIPISSVSSLEEMERLAFDYDNLSCLCSECHFEAHRKLGKIYRTKQQIREEMEGEINDFIERIKNGL